MAGRRPSDGRLDRARAARAGTERAARRRRAGERHGRAYGFERAMDNLGAIRRAAARARPRGRRRCALGDSPLGRSRPARGARDRRRDPFGAAARSPRPPAATPARAPRAARQARTSLHRRLRVRARQRRRHASHPAGDRAADARTGARRRRGGRALLYTAYNAVAALASVPGGKLGDRRGSLLVLALRAACFLVAYAGFAVTALPSRASCSCSRSREWGSGSSRRPSTPPSPGSLHRSSAARPSVSSPDSRASGTSPQAQERACSGRSSRPARLSSTSPPGCLLRCSPLPSRGARPRHRCEGHPRAV